MITNSLTGQSNGMTDRAAQSADSAIKSTQSVANDAFDSLSGTVKDIRDQAAPMVNRATEKASDLAHRGADAVRESSRQLREKAMSVSDATVGYIKDEPVKSILIAAATGAALMGLVSMMSRSRNCD
jgi:ElaB/YqjD/DUF883 family membrane-anchored ribosome-binding protein